MRSRSKSLELKRRSGSRRSALQTPSLVDEIRHRRRRPRAHRQPVIRPRQIDSQSFSLTAGVRVKEADPLDKTTIPFGAVFSDCHVIEGRATRALTRKPNSDHVKSQTFRKPRSLADVIRVRDRFRSTIHGLGKILYSCPDGATPSNGAGICANTTAPQCPLLWGPLLWGPLL